MHCNLNQNVQMSIVEMEDTDSETLLMAMLTVKSAEKAISTKLSRIVSFESLIWPVARRMVHPIDVANVCENVSNHGYEA